VKSKLTDCRSIGMSLKHVLAQAEACTIRQTSLYKTDSQSCQPTHAPETAKGNILSEHPSSHNVWQQHEEIIGNSCGITPPSPERKRLFHDDIRSGEVHTRSCRADIRTSTAQCLDTGSHNSLESHADINRKDVAFAKSLALDNQHSTTSTASECVQSRGSRIYREASTQTDLVHDSDTFISKPMARQSADEALKCEAGEEAVRRKRTQVEIFDEFFSRRAIFMARATRPVHPKAVIKCDIDTPSKAIFRARALPEKNTDLGPGWSEQQFDWVFGITATNEEVFGKIQPIIAELRNPTGRNLCLGVDGFSGCGKSYTMENLLAMVGKELLGESSTNLKIVFEAFQSSGADVSSFNMVFHENDAGSLEKFTEVPKFIAPIYMFRKQRPCYLISSLNAFRKITACTAKFRTNSSTNNNATSSRTHLVIMLHATSGHKTSTLCLFDLAGNERKDALEGVPEALKEKEEQTTAINNSRMNIYKALEATLEGKRQVTRETAVSNSHKSSV
jgi:ABC-type dipeptide/oligopeptide/nickel transport system ATPase subunit